MSSSCYIYDSESELAPFSPASSVSLMSVGSDQSSPSPSPTSSSSGHRYLIDAVVLSLQPFYPCRYNNIYEERLLPLLPSVSESNNKKVPKATHASNYNKNIQLKFEEALKNCDYREVKDLLNVSSDSIDVNLINEEGNSPLQTATLVGSLDLVRLLIRFGADPGVTNRDGWSTLHIAAYSGHSEITQYILINSRR